MVELTVTVTNSLGLHARAAAQLVRTANRFQAGCGSRAPVNALERTRSPEARQTLARLAEGNPTARLTEHAKAALERMDAKQ